MSLGVLHTRQISALGFTVTMHPCRRRQIRVAEARRELVAETRLEFMCVKRGVVKPKVVVGGFEHLRTLHPVHHPEE